MTPEEKLKEIAIQIDNFFAGEPIKLGEKEISRFDLLHTIRDFIGMSNCEIYGHEWERPNSKSNYSYDPYLVICTKCLQMEDARDLP